MPRTLLSRKTVWKKLSQLCRPSIFIKQQADWRSGSTNLSHAKFQQLGLSPNQIQQLAKIGLHLGKDHDNPAVPHTPSTTQEPLKIPFLPQTIPASATNPDPSGIVTRFPKHSCYICEQLIWVPEIRQDSTAQQEVTIIMDALKTVSVWSTLFQPTSFSQRAACPLAQLQQQLICPKLHNPATSNSF